MLPLIVRIGRYSCSFQACSLSLQGWGLIDIPPRAFNEAIPILYPPLKRSGQVALYCAHRATTAFLPSP